MSEKSFSYYWYHTPHGTLSIALCDAQICAIALGEKIFKGRFIASAQSNNCATQLLEYFAGKRRSFDFEYSLCGSAFQKAVWRGLQTVPYGQSITAKELARNLKLEKSFRQVGAALNANPLAIVVPDHRLIRNDGRRITAKEKLRGALLDLERSYLKK